MSFTKKTVAASLSALALVFTVGAAKADAPDMKAPRGSTAQQQATMQCYPTEELQRGLKEQFNMTAKESGDHPDFRLQIYANDKGGWMLAGEVKDNSVVEGATPDMKVSCLLEGDTRGGYPDQVKQKPWYQAFFTASPAVPQI